tara:strand:- start:179 stop:415 length:237 start_codon:yes stop_codon:yes gene_type:complete
MVELRRKLNDVNVKAAIISSILFFILAFPDLFIAVDGLLRSIVGGRFMNIHLVVLTIHSVLFGILFYFANKMLHNYNF